MKSYLSLTAVFALFLISFSSLIAQTPVPCEEPYPQVQNLQATVESQSAELTWDPIIGSMGCRIQLRQVGETAWQTGTAIQPDLDAFSISGSLLAFQTDYEARVACGCSSNPLIIGDFSEMVTFNSGSAGQQVPCEDPYPEVLNPSSAPSAENDGIVLGWDPIPQSLGCQIEYSLLEGGVLNAAQVLESELSSFSIPETDLIPNQDYQWRVRCGCSLNPLVVGPWIEFQEFNSGDIGFDCPDLMANIGDTCDSAINGVVTEDCECLVSSPCGELPPGTVCNPVTGQIWMDRNLGANRVAISPTDAEAFGDLYQWGRGTDGHEKRDSPTSTVLSNSDQPSNGSFIVLPVLTSNGGDWRSPRNDNLWQGEGGINNPCPSGFRIPTGLEWAEEVATWTSQDLAGGFGSVLKLTIGGNRDFDGGLEFVDGNGYYWSSTISGSFADRLSISADEIQINSFYRIYGRSVRCIQD